MADKYFECVTRGDFSPNGLPKIFISCHQDDKKYIRVISQDVLKEADCAVYYLKEEFNESEIDMDDLKLHLSGMSIFIFLVTSKFLQEKSLSKEWIYGFAMRSHITVIPICMESNLEALFATEMNSINAGYGEIQMMNYRSTDLTEIPYLEKLNMALRMVLPTDEDYLEINNAFASHVFLSYRKKDRMYAIELMKRIHDIPGFYNFSIWYDEFLNIGEKWSDEILQMIQTSDVFLLLVTPSLLEKDNYCAVNEYPAAKKSNLQIIPIRMIPMAPEEIQRFHKVFSDAGDVVDGTDDTVLEKSLRKYIPETDQSAESKYFIGLAFLNGLNVEKNPQKAVTLITEAAESEVPEAMEKLSDMYHSGAGTAINYEESVRWIEKTVEFYKSRCQLEANAKNITHLYNVTVKLINALFEISDYNKAYKIIRRLIKTVQFFFNQFDEVQISECLANAYDLAGKILLRQNEHTKALECFQKNCRIREKLSEFRNSTDDYHDLSVAYERLGILNYNHRNYKEAQEWYEKVLNIRTDLNCKLNNKKSNKSLVLIYSELGDLFLRTGELQKAEKHYLKAMRIMKQVLCSDNDFDNQSQYASELVMLGSVALMQNRLCDAEEFFISGFTIYQQISDEEKTVEASRNLSLALNRMGALEFHKQNYEKSAEFYKQSLRLRKRLYETVKNDSFVYDYAVTFYYLAKVYEEGINREQALKYYKKTVSLLESVLPGDQTLDPHYIYAATSFKLFSYDTFHGKPYLRQAIESLKWLTDRIPDNDIYKNDLCNYQLIYERCYPESNDNK